LTKKCGWNTIVIGTIRSTDESKLGHASNAEIADMPVIGIIDEDLIHAIR
jgi:hypothetical protein